MLVATSTLTKDPGTKLIFILSGIIRCVQRWEECSGLPKTTATSSNRQWACLLLSSSKENNENFTHL